MKYISRYMAHKFTLQNVIKRYGVDNCDKIGYIKII